MATKAQHIKAVLDVLRGELGLGEHPSGSNHNKITVWYNKHVDPIGNGAWCEMTNTWAMWTGGAKDLKKGRAYTVWACQDAQKHYHESSWHWGTKGMKAGDQVYYDWSGHKGNEAYVDHTGTVEKILGGGEFYVLEGNTSDRLLRKRRDKTYVVGYVRFGWERLNGEPVPPSSPSTPPSSGKLAVDGQLGPLTITKWQQVMGTPVDGFISPVSDLTMAVQRHLNKKINAGLVVDGMGIRQDNHVYKTVRAIQKYLGTPQDGRMSVPVSMVVKAIQSRLNTNKF